MYNTSSSITKFIDLPVMSVPNTIMTFSQYMQKNDTNLSDNWGWFIDIEPNKNKFINYPVKNRNIIININKYKYNEDLKKHLPIPETICELRSIKSLNNIMYDSESLLFEVEYNNNNNNKNYKNKKRDYDSDDSQIKLGCFIIITCLVIFTFV
jgi:hypothetical protein